MRVISNTAISLDGRINTSRGRFIPLGSERDQRMMRTLRTQADAVLVGGATFRSWPHPSLPDPPRLQLAAAGRPFFNVIVTRGLDAALCEDFVQERRVRPLVLTLAEAPQSGFPVEMEIEGYPGPGRDLPIPWMLAALARRGIETVLVEGGGDLLFQFLAAEALDEMFLTLCPKLIGGPDAPSLVDGPGFMTERLRTLRLLSSEVHDDEVFLHYALRKDR